jgi:hypothetical protein
MKPLENKRIFSISGNLKRVNRSPICCRPSADFINVAKKAGSSMAVTHCQFVPEIVHRAVNIYIQHQIRLRAPRARLGNRQSKLAVSSTDFLVCFFDDDRLNITTQMGRFSGMVNTSE